MTAQQSMVKVPNEHQLVISQQVLEEAGIAPGDQVYVSCVGGCISLTRLSNFSDGAAPANGNGNGHGGNGHLERY